jgi:hypothetical protein
MDDGKKVGAGDFANLVPGRNSGGHLERKEVYGRKVGNNRKERKPTRTFSSGV